MDQLEDLKKIIENKLDTIKVTRRLRKQTIKHIFNSENNFLYFIKRGWVKMTSLISITGVVIFLGIHFYLYDNDKPHSPDTTNGQCSINNATDTSYESANPEIDSTNNCDTP